MKICFKCGVAKEITEYYKHRQMGDGHLNKCKSCTVKDSKATTDKKTSTPEGLEKERERHREKYRRLGYREKQKQWDEKRPWKSSNKYKGLHKKFKTPKGFELHHWSYLENHIEDVVILERKNHRIAHTYLIFDNEKLMFRDLNNELLDSKEKHLLYLILKGVKI